MRNFCILTSKKAILTTHWYFVLGEHLSQIRYLQYNFVSFQLRDNRIGLYSYMIILCVHECLRSLKLPSSTTFTIYINSLQSNTRVIKCTCDFDNIRTWITEVNKHMKHMCKQIASDTSFCLVFVKKAKQMGWSISYTLKESFLSKLIYEQKRQHICIFL